MENPKEVNIRSIKKILIYLVLALEMFLLFKVSANFVQNQKYFGLSKDFVIPFVIILLFSLWTLSLISLTIEKKWEIFLSPIIIFLSSFIFMSQFKIGEALIGAFSVSLYYLLQLTKTLSLNSNILKINIRHSSRPVARGFLFIVSVIISLAVFLMSKNMETLDVGKWAADIAGKPIEDAVKKEYEKEVPEDIRSVNLQSLQESNPQFFAVLNSFGINEIPANIPTSENITESVTGTIKSSISNQVNKAIEPYRKFFNPAIALLVFGLLQIYNSVTFFIFSITVSLVFTILKKTKLIKIQKVPTEKEVLRI